MGEGRLNSLFSYIDTLVKAGREVVLRPQSFFKNMPVKAGYAQPLIFAMAVYLIVLSYNLILIASGLPYPGGQEASGEPFTETLKKVPALAALWLSGLFLGSVILHGSFWLLKGKAGYEATFRIFAYSSIANLLTIIPSVGHYACTISTLVLVMLGGREIHGLSSLRAIAAPILPAIVVWGILMGLIYSGIVPLEKLTATFNQ